MLCSQANLHPPPLHKILKNEHKARASLKFTLSCSALFRRVRRLHSIFSGPQWRGLRRDLHVDVDSDKNRQASSDTVAYLPVRLMWQVTPCRCYHMGSTAELGMQSIVELAQAGPFLGSQLNHAIVGARTIVLRTLTAEMAFRPLPWQQQTLHCMTIEAFWKTPELGKSAAAARI